MIELRVTGRDIAWVKRYGDGSISIKPFPGEFISNYKRTARLRAAHSPTAPSVPTENSGAGAAVPSSIGPSPTPMADNDHPDDPPRAA